MWVDNFAVLVEVMKGRLGFPLELHGDLGDPLVFLPGMPISWGCEGAPRDSPSVTAGMNRVSSRAEAGTSGFLSFSDIDLRFHRVSTE